MSVKPVARVSVVQGLHQSIPRHFCHDRRGRYGGRPTIAANDAPLRHRQ
jgi:hypothetical protein